MTTQQYLLCVTEAQNYSDRDAYLSDLALSSVWEDEPESAVPADRLEALGNIYDAVHRSIRDIASASGLTQRKLMERFCIPRRTMEDWSTGTRSCPVYTLLLIQESLGIFHPPID